MPKRYRISEVAKLLDITPEAIRYYERLGLINPVRDEKNGYRYYGTWDIHMLNRARSYHELGFPLEEGAELLAKPSDLDVAEALEEREQELQQEISYEMNLLRRIRESRANIRDAASSIGNYRIERRPALYRLHTQNRYEQDRNPEIQRLMKEWETHAAFMDSSAMFKLEDLYAGNNEFSFGLVLEESYADFLHVKKSEYVEYFESCPCLYTAMESRDSVNQGAERYEGLLKEMSRRGFIANGPLLTRVVVMRKPDNEYFNLHQMWLPFMV
ncbi:MAG: MerR family transcriptional regulator [Lachnospiraceae bacterium]|nr:MerR family transcriptional regulator [Lachnospiraceae bacterium]